MSESLSSSSRLLLSLARGSQQVESGYSPWQPDSAQLTILERSDLTPDQKVNEIVARNRSHLWRSGTVDDIEMGDYPVEYHPLSHNPSLVGQSGLVFDWVNPCATAENWKVLGGGYARGLKENIALNVGGIPTLVMDKHNFAAAWILDLQQSGVLPMPATMVHFDEHEDRFHRKGSRLDVADFLRQLPTRDAVRELLLGTGIGSWIEHPLLSHRHITADPYASLELDGAGTESDFVFHKKESRNGKAALVSPDIVDIDIDIVNRLDERLSPSVHARLASSGEIPTAIAVRLLAMAEVAARAKAITIATSPCFIYQPNAIRYVKQLIRYIEQIRGL